MIRRLRRIRDAILGRFPESRLEPLTKKQLAAVKKRFPKVPAHILKFFEIVGCGSIGESRYMIYDLIDGAEIFGRKSAHNLEGTVLIGDDFAGHHEAYLTTSKWQFGMVGGNGLFRPHTDHADFVDFIEKWFVEGEAL